MNYLTNYYKNLCEQLQEKINILEAGLQQAMKTGEPALMSKELSKAKARKERKVAAAEEQEAKAEKEKKSFFGPGRSAMRQMTANALRAQAERIGQNVEKLHQQLDADYPEIGASLTQEELPTEVHTTGSQQY
jgi:serine phosphatase RsbU (regulator of sigma subunit)